MSNTQENLPIKSSLYEAIVAALARGIAREDVLNGVGIETSLWNLFDETGLNCCQVFDFVESHLGAIA